jgi:integrase
MHLTLLDTAGHQRAAVTLPGHHAGRPPRNKGRRYPPDPPTVEEIIAVMRTAGAGPDGARLRALIVVLWRAGLRISEALALAETDMESRRGAVLVRHGKATSVARSGWTPGDGSNSSPGSSSAPIFPSDPRRRPARSHPAPIRARRTSGSPRSTSKELITRRSSTRFTPDDRP